MRKNVCHEKKYRYMLFRIQQALAEMDESKVYVGRRHLENALYVCEGCISSECPQVTREEMEAIKRETFAEEDK